jgi:hypothetical protein
MNVYFVFFSFTAQRCHRVIGLTPQTLLCFWNASFASSPLPVGCSECRYALKLGIGPSKLAGVNIDTSRCAGVRMNRLCNCFTLRFLLELFHMEHIFFHIEHCEMFNFHIEPARGNCCGSGSGPGGAHRHCGMLGFARMNAEEALQTDCSEPASFEYAGSRYSCFRIWTRLKSD